MAERTRPIALRPVARAGLVLERGLLDATRLDEILSVESMTRGGIVGENKRTPGD